MSESAHLTRSKRVRSEPEPEDDSSGAAKMAPTTTLGLNKYKQELELAKFKLECQAEKIKDLIVERDFLKGQVSELTRNTSQKNSKTSPEATEKPDSESSESSLLSSDSSNSSDSSDSSASSPDDGKRKRKKSKKKIMKQKGKGKKQKREKGRKTDTRRYVSRARGPDEVVARYRRVLSAFKKKKTISAACEKVRVDRNTIACSAPIAELAIGAPETYAELKEQHTGKLSQFTRKCTDAIEESEAVVEAVQALKKAGKLLPLGKVSF